MYNAELYIEKCIQSVLNNDFDNYELLLIDDGSKDSSYEVIRKYESDKVRIFQHENQGVGFTRNFGIRKASGDHIIFIDSDDYVDKDYLKKLFLGIGDDEIAISGLRYVDLQGKVTNTRTIDNNAWGKYRLPLTAGKIFKRKFLSENALFYPDYHMGEDVFFNTLAYSKTSKISMIEYVGYNCLQNPDSITHSFSRAYDMLPMLKKLNEEISQSPYLEKNYTNFFFRKTIIHNVLLQRKSTTLTEQKKMLREGLDWAITLDKKIFIFLSEETVPINLFVNTILLFYKLGLTSLILWIIKKF